MAKKQKRSVSGATRSAATTRPAAARTSASAPTERPATTTPARSSYIQEFKPDYSPVIADLKKIGILAASFITILVVLSFFLR